MHIGYYYIAKDKNGDIRLFENLPMIIKKEKTKEVFNGKTDPYGKPVYDEVGIGEYEEVLGYRVINDNLDYIDKGVVINSLMLSDDVRNNMQYGDKPRILTKIFDYDK